jgi:hypothetical protein
VSDNRAKWIEAIVAISSFGVGCVYGSFVEFQHQKTIYEVLRNTSAIIFGVVGAWYAVITPMYLGSEDKNGKKSKYARVSVYGFLDTFLVNQAATFTASFWMARTAAGVL